MTQFLYVIRKVSAAKVNERHKSLLCFLHTLQRCCWADARRRKKTHKAKEANQTE